jgi:SAM-dependent methyltransferase
MHDSVMAFAWGAVDAADVEGLRVLEVGSRDINGSLRGFIEAMRPAQYVGVDMIDGPGVDKIVDCEHLCATMGAAAWDMVICTEMLEHAHDWRGCMIQMVRALKPGGLLLLTTRSPGFPRHGYPDDYWRFTTAHMARICEALQLCASVDPDPDPTAPGVFVFARKFVPHGTRAAGQLKKIDPAPAP